MLCQHIFAKEPRKICICTKKILNIFAKTYQTIFSKSLDTNLVGIMIISFMNHEQLKVEIIFFAGHRMKTERTARPHPEETL